MPWMSHSNARNTNWSIWQNEDRTYDADTVTRAILLDIREELRAINRTLNCSNCLAIPRTLQRIARNTHKPKKRRPRKDLHTS